ncbi:MAG: alpha/beta hydrolase [Myxococcaceae bacterium]
MRLPLLLAVLACLGLACGPPPPSRDDGGLPPDASTGFDAGTDAGTDAGSTGDPCEQVTSAAADLDNYTGVLACLRAATSLDAAKDQAIATFVNTADSRGGFPLAASGQVVFVYVKDARWDVEVGKRPEEHFDAANRQEPLRVAGDFNAWDPAQGALKAEGRGFFHAALTLAAPAGKRWKYKLVAKNAGGGDVWFSDPLSRRFDFDANGRISLVRGGDTQGHLEWIRTVHAAQLNVDRPIYLYVPRGYDVAPATTRYPVLYMHDGNNVFDPDQPRAAGASWDADGTAEAEISAGRAREFVIVGVPNNENRFGEYTHNTDVVGGQTVGGDGDKYADFLVHDLKPAVDGRYRTLTGRESTGLLGSSLGGLISYYVGLKNPAVYKYVGGMSSTFGWGTPTAITLFSQAADLSTRDQVYYLDSGGGPPSAGPCLYPANDDSTDNYCETLAMKSALETLGVNRYPLDPDATTLMPADVNVMHWWTQGAPHNEAAWRVRLHRVFRLFFRP